MAWPLDALFIRSQTKSARNLTGVATERASGYEHFWTWWTKLFVDFRNRLRQTEVISYKRSPKI